MARWIPLLLVVCSGCSPLIYLAAGGAPDEVPAIALGTPAHGTTLSAHDDFDPHCSGDALAPDMAYALEVPRSGRYAVRVRATYDVVLAIYDGDTLVACNDSHDEEDLARLLVPLDAGRTYTVVVDGFGGAEGQYVLAVDERPTRPEPATPTPPAGESPPVEDHASMARRCEAAPTLSPGATDGVLIPTDAHAVVSCGAGGRGPETVYRIVLDGPAELTVEVTSDVDAIVELRRGCSEGHEVLACVDDAPDARHTGLSATLEPGEYFLLVDSYSPDAGGPFHLEVLIAPLDVVADEEEDETP